MIKECPKIPFPYDNVIFKKDGWKIKYCNFDLQEKDGALEIYLKIEKEEMLPFKSTQK